MRLVASTSSGVGAAVLRVSSGCGVTKGEARRVLHFRGGRLAAAAVAVGAAECVLRR